jgi:hypothetical protein
MNATFQQDVTKLRAEVSAFQKAFASRKKTEYTPQQLRTLAPEMSQVLQQDVSVLERNVLMMKQVIRRFKSKGRQGQAKTLQRAIDALQPYIKAVKGNLKEWTTLAKAARANAIKKPRKVNNYLVRSPRKQANKIFVDLHYKALQSLKANFPQNRNVHGWHHAVSNKTNEKKIASRNNNNNANDRIRQMANMQSKITSQIFKIRGLETQLNATQTEKKRIEKALMDCVMNSTK